MPALIAGASCSNSDNTMRKETYHGQSSLAAHDELPIRFYSTCERRKGKPTNTKPSSRVHPAFVRDATRLVRLMRSH